MIEHGKRILTESFYEGNLSSVKEELEVSVLSSKQGLLKDVIDALAIINNGETRKLELTIQVDTQNRYRIVRKWVV